MPELHLTRSCSFTCGHCPCAESVKRGAEPGDLISWEDLIYAADFLLASGERRLIVSGGEPSLHPEFAAMAAEQCEHLLAKLDDNQRQIALLRLEGYGVSEIAEQMDCVPATVRRQINRIQLKWSEED